MPKAPCIEWLRTLSSLAFGCRTDLRIHGPNGTCCVCRGTAHDDCGLKVLSEKHHGLDACSDARCPGSPTSASMATSMWSLWPANETSQQNSYILAYQIYATPRKLVQTHLGECKHHIQSILTPMRVQKLHHSVSTLV